MEWPFHETTHVVCGSKLPAPTDNLVGPTDDPFGFPIRAVGTLLEKCISVFNSSWSGSSISLPNGPAKKYWFIFDYYALCCRSEWAGDQWKLVRTFWHRSIMRY